MSAHRAPRYSIPQAVGEVLLVILVVIAKVVFSVVSGLYSFLRAVLPTLVRAMIIIAIADLLFGNHQRRAA